jgi:hypothetical protein
MIFCHPSTLYKWDAQGGGRKDGCQAFARVLHTLNLVQVKCGLKALFIEGIQKGIASSAAGYARLSSNASEVSLDSLRASMWQDRSCTTTLHPPTHLHFFLIIVFISLSLSGLLPRSFGVMLSSVYQHELVGGAVSVLLTSALSVVVYVSTSNRPLSRRFEHFVHFHQDYIDCNISNYISSSCQVSRTFPCQIHRSLCILPCLERRSPP